MVVAGALAIVLAQDFAGHPTHDLLLAGDVMAGVDDPQIEFLGKLIIDLEHTSLEEAKALGQVGR
jgi:hypothetical protein